MTDQKDIRTAELMKRLKVLKDKVVERREQFDELMEFVEKETVYLTTPASTKYHLNCEQGLLEHSINVAETMLKIKAAIAPKISDESCVIVALMHDLGKAGMPGNPLYIKNPPDSQFRYPYYWNGNLTYLSVPVRSLYLVAQRFPLTEEEVQAIVYHDGQYVEDNRSVATNETPLTLLLQYADTWSGFVLEEKF
ncbi:HD domain-containing protein [uncultured Anaerovibrio sp.]|uniref:HD domain-containing protein n=1 Tax=uncultured Anaerovibrio sp. TaxID=361586 RepID=UPI0025D78EDF|nr:HD domain-containing protein [uncultured Anaerovibrio sp.]